MIAAAGELRPARAWAILAVISLGALLGGAELMVVAIALPSIVPDFGGWGDLGRTSWIIDAYLMAYVVAMPLAGRAADVWGARRLYGLGLALFAAGSLAVALAPPLGIDGLIAARMIQGFGGGALVPLSLSMAAHLFAGRDRATAMGIEGAAVFVGMAVGPAYAAWVLLNVAIPLGGWQLHPWQWIFLLNVPVAGACGLILHLVAGKLETRRAPGSLDLMGAVLLSGGLVLETWAVGRAGQVGLTDPGVVAGTLGAGVLLALFAWRAWHQRAPLLDLRLFRDRGFTAANLLSLLTGYTLATAVIGGPVFVSQVLYAGPDRSAAVLAALTVAIALGAVAGGVAAGRIGERTTVVVGVVLTAIALLAASDWGVNAKLGRLQRDLAIYGIGFGLTVAPRATAALERVAPAAYGMASAMLQLARATGMSVGVAFLSGLAERHIDALNLTLNSPAGRDALVARLGHPELVGVDPGSSLPLIALLGEVSRGAASGVLGLVFVIAAAVAVATLIPALVVGGRGRGSSASGELS